MDNSLKPKVHQLIGATWLNFFMELVLQSNKKDMHL